MPATEVAKRTKPNTNGAKQKSATLPILPALLVVIISVAVVGIFAPEIKLDIWGTVAPFLWKVKESSLDLGAPFDVVDIPGRGKGVIAGRDIKQGELLIKEKPLFVVPKRLTDRTDPRALIRTTVSSLSPSDQSAFFDLSYAKPNTSTPDIPFEIFQTNAISAGSVGTGIFPRTARLNHGCSKAFSAVYFWREKEGVLVVHAIRDIKKGQEILTTYTDTKRPRRDRQAYLHEIYHFDCACAVCSLPDKESAASDRRLSLMVDLRSRFAMWEKGDIKGAEAVKLAKRIWSIGGTEGYLSERGQLAADVAHVAAGHSDTTAVRQWAILAHKWYAIELGPDSEQCRTALRISHRPENHGAWGSREEEHVGGTEDVS